MPAKEWDLVAIFTWLAPVIHIVLWRNAPNGAWPFAASDMSTSDLFTESTCMTGMHQPRVQLIDACMQAQRLQYTPLT